MVLVVSTTEIRIPKSKGKINGRVVSKRSYVFYFINNLLRSVLEPTPINEINALSERITDLVLRKAKALDTVRIYVSTKYSGYVRIAGKIVGNYDFTLTIYIKDKVISVYEVRRNFDSRLFDVRFRIPRRNDDLSDFANIADFAKNHNSIMPRFDVPNDFVNIANYVMDYVRTYGKERKRSVSDYHVITNFARFVETLNMFHDSFLSSETTKLIGTKFTFLAYKYLKESGYFAYIAYVNNYLNRNSNE